jgi:succinate dehydrogenase/fumarate reductase flavoprotein subunit
MRALECSFIRDCAEMAARASLFRTESRWGLYHYRLDYPELNNDDWFCHVNLKQDEAGEMVAFKRPVAPYIVPLETGELTSYHRIRVPQAANPSLTANP